MEAAFRLKNVTRKYRKERVKYDKLTLARKGWRWTRSTCLVKLTYMNEACVPKLAHMGHFPQDGENEENLSEICLLKLHCD